MPSTAAAATATKKQSMTSIVATIENWMNEWKKDEPKIYQFAFERWDRDIFVKLFVFELITMNKEVRDRTRIPAFIDENSMDFNIVHTIYVLASRKYKNWLNIKLVK